jgi:hypothetical protein
MLFRYVVTQHRTCGGGNLHIIIGRSKSGSNRDTPRWSTSRTVCLSSSSQPS